MGNKILNKARKEKNDEFYTPLTIIEDELYRYKKYFENKVVYCNADDPEESNFIKHFKTSFSELKLKQLKATCYKHTNFSIFEDQSSGSGCYYVYGNPLDKYNKPTLLDKKILKGNGDFRSKECVKILKESDIVVTNPPFSLFKEFIDILMEHEKKFIILGNIGACGYHNIFDYIKNNKIWLGYNRNITVEFRIPKHYKNLSKSFNIKEDGNNYVKVSGITWFTNLPVEKNKEKIPLVFEYDPKLYPKYDNYDAIEVSETKKIPKDYYGVMGVPISFLTKYNPEQFDIIGITSSKKYDKKRVGIPLLNGDDGRAILNGKVKYTRVLIKRKEMKK